MRRICAAIGWILAFAIFVLSVVPPSDRPTTGTSSGLEHVVIYLLLSIAFAIGYWDRLMRVVIGLILFSGFIEAVQLFVPGRHARLSDLVIDIAASCVGVAATFAAGSLIGIKTAN